MYSKLASIVAITLILLPLGCDSSFQDEPSSSTDELIDTIQICSETDLDECEDTSTCSLQQGRRLNSKDSCWSLPRPYNCVSRDSVFPDATTIAVSAQGDCWTLPQLSLPDGWTKQSRWESVSNGVDSPCPSSDEVIDRCE